MISKPTVYIVDDDDAVRGGLSFLLESEGLKVEAFDSAAAFLATSFSSEAIACLVLDVRMPQMTGPELQAELTHQGIKIPVIFLSGYGDIPLAVKAIKAGAFDFLTKPVNSELLIDKIQQALALSRSKQESNAIYRASYKRLGTLTKREHEILKLALEGLSNKRIAALLNISTRTVEHHRSHILLKTGVDSLLKLSRLIDIRN